MTDHVCSLLLHTLNETTKDNKKMTGDDLYMHSCLFSNPVELVYCMLCCYYLVID